jgi:low affinity Fe/Cu permease
LKRASKPDPGSRPLPFFTQFSHFVARLAGTPVAFFIATAVIVVWAVTGPIFGYSDTWQLVINTGTTIVTFLMVFLIQNTQNRDVMALQLKLSELIIAVQGAHNDLATLEDMSDEDLETLHSQFCEQATLLRGRLESRGASAQK